MKLRHPPARRCAGFTLVEVLVALMIMAVLAAMAWQGIDAMLRARTINQENIERTLRLSNVLSQWEQDLQAVYAPAPPTGTPGAPAAANPVEPISCAGGEMRLARRARDGAQDGVQIVVWALREGRLQRWASPVTNQSSTLVDHWMRSQQLLGNESGQLRVVEGVNSMQMYFYRDNAWSNCQSSAGTSSRVPKGVRVEFGLGTVGGGQQEGNPTLVRDVLMPPAPPSP
jgi:general secretion pathway protein J